MKATSLETLASIIDYDSDFQIETEREGFVDLYDFAQRAATAYSEPAVVNAAHAVVSVMETAVVAAVHRSGFPWFDPPNYWNLDNINGLSIFLPLGEDLEFQIEITETFIITGAAGDEIPAPARLLHGRRAPFCGRRARLGRHDRRLLRDAGRTYTN